MAFPKRQQGMGEDQQIPPSQRNGEEASFEHSLSPEPLRLVRFDDTTAEAHDTDGEAHIRAMFRQNPEQGFELLFRRYYAPLCSHALRVVYTRSAAEDIVSDVMMRFWQQRVYERHIASFRAYLFVAVRNRALNHLKQELLRGLPKKHQESGKEDAFMRTHHSSPTPEELAEYEEVRFRIETGIESLSKQCKKVFFMSRFDGKKNAAIAQELNISVRAVEAHITKALQTLKRLLQDYGLLLLLWWAII
jgi:RNA polymerase sigma-70 factor (ECF subfamily)